MLPPQQHDGAEQQAHSQSWEQTVDQARQAWQAGLPQPTAQLELPAPHEVIPVLQDFRHLHERQQQQLQARAIGQDVFRPEQRAWEALVNPMGS